MSKFCGKCGTALNDDEMFCHSCGAAQQENNSTPVKQNVANLVTNLSGVTEKIKKMPKNKLIKIGAIAGIIIIAIIVAVSVGTNVAKYKTIDFKDYLTVQFDGLDGAGTANYDWQQEDAFYIEVARGLGIDIPDYVTDIDDAIDYSTGSRLESVCDSIEITLDKKDGLKNGDEVVLKALYNKDMFKSYGIKFKNDEITFKVDGLKEGTEFDAFQGLEIVYSGASPYLNAEVNTSKCTDFAKNYITYKIQDYKNLKNGDTVKVNVTYNQSAAVENGYLITTTEKDFKIENQPAYLSNPSGFDISALESEISDKLAASTVIDGWGNFAGMNVNVKSVNSSALKTKLILNHKDEGSDGDINRVIYIYEYSLNTNDGAKKAFVAITAKNIYVGTDKKVAGFNRELDVNANEDYTALYDELVTKSKEHYNVQDFSK